jgi:hypothetical protein
MSLSRERIDNVFFTGSSHDDFHNPRTNLRAQRRMTDFAVRDGFVGHRCRLSITSPRSWSRMASPAGMACNRGESRRCCVRTGPRRRSRETALGMTARPGNPLFGLIRPVHAPMPAASGGRRGSSPAPRLRRPVE